MATQVIDQASLNAHLRSQGLITTFGRSASHAVVFPANTAETYGHEMKKPQCDTWSGWVKHVRTNQIDVVSPAVSNCTGQAITVDYPVLHRLNRLSRKNQLHVIY